MSGTNRINLKYHTTGLVVNALIIGPDKTQRWNGTALAAFSSITDAAWGTGLVTCTEQETDDATPTKNYVGNFPATAPAGDYAIEFYEGASPAPGDNHIGQQQLMWGGAAEVHEQTIQADATTLLARLTSGRAGFLDNLSAGAVATAASLATVDDLLDTEVAEIISTLATLSGLVDDLESRLTATRAAYLDKLNITGNVAASGEVTSISNNTRVVRTLPSVFERPDSGSTVFRVELFLYDDDGNMEAPDSAPTLGVVNQSGTSRDANLDSTTMSLVNTGHYRATYTIDTAHSLEQLIFTFSVVEGGATRSYGNTGLVVDTTAVDFTSSDRTKLDTLHDTRLTAARAGFLDALNGHVAQTGDGYPIVNSGSHGNAALKTLIDAKPTAAANATALLTDLLSSSNFNTAGSFGTLIKDNIDAAISSRSTVTEAQVNTQVDLALADVGLTTVVTGRIDAAVSSRMATFVYTAAPTVGQIRTEMEVSGSKLERLWRRFFKKIKKSDGAGTIEMFADDGTTVILTASFTSVGGVETVNAAS